MTDDDINSSERQNNDTDSVQNVMNFNQEVLSGTTAQIVRTLIGIIGIIVFAVVLGPTSFGGATLILTIVTITEQPIFGWATACKQRIASDRLSDGAAIVILFVGTILWTVFVAVCALIFAPTIRMLTGLQWGWVFFPLLLLTTVLLAALRVIIEGKGLLGAATWYEAAVAITTTPLQVVLVLMGYGAYGMLGGLVIGAGVLIPFATKTFGLEFDQPTKNDVHSVLEFAQWSILQTLLGRLYSRLDILLLGFIIGPTPVGWYEVAWKVALPSGIISQVASDGLMTDVAVKSTSGKEVVNKFTSRIRQTLDVGCFLAIPAFFGSLVIGKPLLIEAFGPAYRSAAPFLIGLTLFQVIFSQTLPLMQTLNGIDKIRLTVPITAITLVINASVGFTLIPTIGPIGVVVASIIAQLVQYILSLVILARLVGTFSPVTRLHIIEVIAGLTMATAIYTIPIEFEGIPLVASLIMLGIVIYFSVILALSERSRRFAREQIVRQYLT